MDGYAGTLDIIVDSITQQKKRNIPGSFSMSDASLTKSTKANTRKVIIQE
jgi:hypothetical protein